MKSTFSTNLIITLLAALTIQSTAVADPTEDLFECLDAGRVQGETALGQFCRLLEAEYREEELAASYRKISVQFCEVAIAHQCRNSFQRSLGRYPLCRQLVANGWHDARRQFQASKEAACPLPEVKRCPFPAWIHKNTWCRVPFTRRYWTHSDGLWWQYVRTNYDSAGQKYYVVRARDGATRTIRPEELVLVSN